MPAQNGTLTPAEKQQIATWIQQKASNGPICPLTGQTGGNWTIGDYLVAPNVFLPGGGTGFGGATVPQIFLISPVGAIVYIAAGAAGLQLTNPA